MLGLHSGAVEAPSEGAETAPETTSPRPAATPRARVRTALTLLLGLATTVAWSWSAVQVLDASTQASPLFALRTGSAENAAPLLSVLVVWTFVLLLVALVGRLWLALGVATALTGVVALVNVAKLELRNDPVYPGDVVFLSQPGFLLDMVPGHQVVLGALGLVGLVLASAGVGWLVAKVFPAVSRTVSRRGLLVLRVTRAVVVLVCLGLLNLANDFNEPGNPWRAAFDSTGLRWRYWDQRVNYERNGFVAGLLYNMHVTAMTKPKGYSEATVEEVVRRYRARAAALNAGRTATLDDTNVVIVLGESFTDPTWLTTVDFPETPIPRTTELMENTVSGRMLAPAFGGGTANVEFEVLTGQSLSQLTPQLGTPYEQLVSKQDSFPSAVGWFRDRGHRPVAIHPFSPRMYARPKVFETFGFDEFVTKDDMRNTGRGGGRFIDDASSFAEVRDQIRESDAPVLAHVITMQNHMPYGGQYDDPITPTGLPKANARLAGQYARGLARTDEALAEFLDQLEKDPEPTAVIFYGDHLPAQVYPDDLQKREGYRLTHETPWLIWSSERALPHTDLPTTSPTQFLPKLFNALEVPLPPWYVLLDSVGQEIPAMDRALWIGPDNEPIRRRDLSPEARRVLADYRMIMYDLSIGERWSQDAMFGDPPAQD